MGSHGSGSNLTNGEDHSLVNSLEPEERFVGMPERTLRNCEDSGVLGTLRLWATKTARTWSNGHSNVSGSMTHNESGGSLAYELMGGTTGPLRHIWSRVQAPHRCRRRAFHASRSRKKRGAFPYLATTLVLTPLVGIGFYCLWEAKSVYSAPFVLVMIVLVEEGWGYAAQCIGKSAVARRAAARRAALLSIVLTLALAAIPLCRFSTTPNLLRYLRIRSNTGARVDDTGLRER